MKLDDFGLDRVKLFGLPYHGLWKAGSITLPNAATKTCPAPGNGGVTLVKIPDRPTVSRSEDELAADGSAGREWRNYGLVSGGRMGSLNPVYGSMGTAVVLLIDDAKKAWTMHITGSSSHTYLTVKLRRFAYIKKPWVEEEWVASFNVSVNPYFNSALVGRTLLTVCQNSTGREFVLGSVVFGSGSDYCNGLLKINVSGSVDPGASDCGLAFSGTLIGGQNFETGTHAINHSVTGDFTIVHVTEYFLYMNGSPTGDTTNSVTIVTNGVEVRNDGIPPNPPSTPEGDFVWIQGETTHSSDSTRVAVDSETRDITIPMWAGYHNDTLKVLTAQIAFVEYDDREVFTYLNHTGLPERNLRFLAARTKKSSCEITYRYGNTVVGHRKAEHTDSYSDRETNLLPALAYTQTTGPAGIDLSGGISLMGWVDSNNEPSATYEAPFVFPLIVSGIPWSTPCLASVTRVGDEAPFSWETQKVVAPSGAEKTTSIDKASLCASWHPVTDVIEVDSTLICWF